MLTCMHFDPDALRDRAPQTPAERSGQDSTSENAVRARAVGKAADHRPGKYVDISPCAAQQQGLETAGMS